MAYLQLTLIKLRVFDFMLDDYICKQPDSMNFQITKLFQI